MVKLTQALDFPTGQLSATIISPDGTSLTVGPHAIKGALAQQATSEFGEQLVRNSNNPDMIYGLTTYSDDFDLTLDQYGEYLVSLEGSVTDIYGQSLEISGNYSIYIAELLDIETGVFPGTPFEVGDSYSPTVIVQPGVPAKVTVSLSHFPNSSESARIDKLFAGDANRFGYFTPSGEDFSFGEPGEYLANYTAEYTSPEGVLWMASRRWASIVETPNNRIITHGHRGKKLTQKQNSGISWKTAVCKMLISFRPIRSAMSCGCQTRLSGTRLCKTSSHSMMAMGLLLN